MKAYYDKKPSAVEPVGNGNHLYRWNIEEETVTMHEGMENEPIDRIQYVCEEATINGEPAYDKCVEAVIRSRWSSDAEMALINKYNGYQLGIHQDSSIDTEYKEFLSFVNDAKEMVRRDLGIE